MVSRIIYHISVLESRRAIAIELKRAMFGFDISLPDWIAKNIKLHHLWLIVMFTYETKAC